jgi:hypothetical protein
MKWVANSHVAKLPDASLPGWGDYIGQYGRGLRALRALVLCVAVGCMLFGLVSLFMPDSTWSVLYLIGFPLLCLILFAF